MSVIAMTDLDLSNKRVLIREDLNVPVKNGKVTSDARLKAALPSIQQALKAGAKVMVMSHLGRPTEGEYDEEFSLQPQQFLIIGSPCAACVVHPDVAVQWCCFVVCTQPRAIVW